MPVPDGETASVAVVLANTGGSGEQALSLVLVDLNQDGVTRSAVETIDPTRGHAEINFDNADASLLGGRAKVGTC